MTQPNIKDELINLFARQLDKQTEKGVQKYGHTLDDCPSDKYDWLEMANQELIDLAQYQQKEIRRLRKALKFYADPENYEEWEDSNPETEYLFNVHMDEGNTARRALEEKN